MSNTTTYRYEGRIAECLGSGRPMGFGETATLSPAEVDDSHNRGLIERGLLVELPSRKPAAPARKAEKSEQKAAGE